MQVDYGRNGSYYFVEKSLIRYTVHRHVRVRLMEGMFTWDEDSNYCWFNANSFESSDQYFLVGVVLGLAIYNSTILDIHLPLTCYKKLLGLHCGLDDLRLFKPTIANSLEKLLAYEEDDFEEVFGLDFVGQREGFGKVETVELVPGGSRKPVTKANRHGTTPLFAYVDS